MRRIVRVFGLALVGAMLSAGPALFLAPRTAWADVDLPPDSAPAPDTGPQGAPQDSDLEAYGEESPDPYGPASTETIDGPPPGIETHPVFRGSRNNPPYFGVSAFLYVGKLDSEMEFENDGSGSLVSSDSNLPINDGAAAASLEAWIQIGENWTVMVGVFGTGAEEKGSVGRSFTHDGQRFDRGDEIDVELSQGLLWIGARFLIVNSENIKFGIPFGAVLTYQRLRVSRTGEGADDDDDINAAEGTIEQWSPYLGLYMDFYFGYGFGLETEMRFFAWGDESETSFAYFDADAKLYCTLADHVRLFVGVRTIAVDYVNNGRTNDRVSSWQFTGFQAGLSLYF